MSTGTRQETVALWRPVETGDRPGEASGWREWPPAQFAEQSIFGPVVSEEDDATIIARDWNVKHPGQWLT